MLWSSREHECTCQPSSHPWSLLNKATPLPLQETKVLSELYNACENPTSSLPLLRLLMKPVTQQVLLPSANGISIYLVAQNKILHQYFLDSSLTLIPHVQSITKSCWLKLEKFFPPPPLPPLQTKAFLSLLGQVQQQKCPNSHCLLFLLLPPCPFWSWWPKQFLKEHQLCHPATQSSIAPSQLTISTRFTLP